MSTQIFVGFTLVFYGFILAVLILIAWSVVTIVNCFRDRRVLTQKCKDYEDRYHMAVDQLREVQADMASVVQLYRRNKTTSTWVSNCELDAMQEQIDSLRKQLHNEQEKCKTYRAELKRRGEQSSK